MRQTKYIWTWLPEILKWEKLNIYRPFVCPNLEMFVYLSFIWQQCRLGSNAVSHCCAGSDMVAWGAVFVLKQHIITFLQILFSICISTSPHIRSTGRHFWVWASTFKSTDFLSSTCIPFNLNTCLVPIKKILKICI